MGETPQHTPAGSTAAYRYSAADLAHFAGADQLSAGAAVAGEAGRRLRARLLADEMTAGHRVMMRLAARADYAMTNAANLGDRHALPFDLIAARFAGTAGRLMDQYRRGAASLPAIGRPDEEDEGEWIGFGFEGQPPLSPEEEERRIARAKAKRAAHLDPRPQPPPLTPAEQGALTEADAVARRLTAEAQVDNLTAAETAPAREQLFLDEVSAGHRMMMRLAGRADWQIDRLGAADAEPEPTQYAVLRLSSAAARLMERVRLGLLALGRLQSGPGGGPRKVAGYYYTGPAGTYGFHNEDVPANDSPAADPAAAGHLPAARLRQAGGVDRANLRRGRLKNGNPSGDYKTAPRCGAKTRAGGCCRQPAMASPRGSGGRCRLHGGKSTGPRTAAGLARSRRARLTHGFRSAEVIELRKAAAATSRRLRALLSGTSPAGHGVDRHDLRVVTGTGTETTSRPHAAGEGGEGASRRPAAAGIVPLSAGHGLHRRDSHLTPAGVRRPQTLVFSRASGRGLW
ncbi:MAG: HGGxSTG domain-containing protein [Dongiaceae bacterium]